MTDWIKSIQSLNRSIRKGEMTIASSGGRGSSKSIMLDIKSEDFIKSFSETFRPHYAEYRDFDTGETYWKKYNRLPNRMLNAYSVIRYNEDGSYEYIKNRFDEELRKLTDEEAMWLILKAGG